MSDRRRANRFVVPESACGSLRLMQDMYVEQVGSDAVVVVSDVPVSPGEELVLELPRELGSRSIVQVQAQTSTVIWVGETRRYRVRLVTPSVCPSGNGDEEPFRAATSPPAMKVPLPAIAVLIRCVPVRVRDLSTAGCLLETSDALPEGGVGRLELVVNGQNHSETLRVCRSVRFPGSPWPWRSGAQFLALGAPAQVSVRNAVARFELIDELGSVPEALAQIYRGGGPK